MNRAKSESWPKPKFNLSPGEAEVQLNILIKSISCFSQKYIAN